MSADDNEELVAVYWQGDVNRRSEVIGTFMASMALVRYVELHHLAERDKGLRGEMQRLSEHFTAKTGQHLHYSAPAGHLLETVADAAEKLGIEAVVSLLKKAAGL